MDRSQALQTLNSVLENGAETRSSIAKRLGIHPSQVSRIASGQFARMDGNALKVCKLAQSVATKDSVKTHVRNDQKNRLQALVLDLLMLRPEVAESLEVVLASLLAGSADE